MTRIPDTTADAVVYAVEAVVARHASSTAQEVADFIDMPLASSQSALDLAEDLGLVASVTGGYEPAGPLARLLVTPDLTQKAAVLRVAVETYEPFRVFRERLHLGGNDPSIAAQQTRALLGLGEHREIIKQTLLSLGTFCQSLRVLGGGQYEVRFDFEDQLTNQLAGAIAELAEAELRVRDWLSEPVRSSLDASSVLAPLAESYLKVSQGDSRGAVVTAGNAVESHLAQLGVHYGVAMSGAHGIGAKVAALDGGSHIPKKLSAIGKYLSNVRNAADHGIDPDVNRAWDIRSGSGEDFLRVAITFIEATSDHRDGRATAL